MVKDNPMYVLDNEAFFARYPVVWDEFSKSIISEIDKGTYYDNFTFKDRLGVKLYNSCLSTGAKTLLNIYSHPEYIFDFREAGDNCIELFLTRMTGSIYIPRLQESDLFWLKGRKSLKISLNGIWCKDFWEVADKV